jgi:hypothetical protein
MQLPRRDERSARKKKNLRPRRQDTKKRRRMQKRGKGGVVYEQASGADLMPVK